MLRRPSLFRPATNPINIAYNVLLVLTGLVVLALGLMFSVVLLGVVLFGGAILALVFWWKSRKLRKQLGYVWQARQTPEAEMPAESGRIIEGEVLSSQHEPRLLLPSEQRSDAR